jgi:iron-sulfur cluster assembly 2
MRSSLPSLRLNSIQACGHARSIPKSVQRIATRKISSSSVATTSQVTLAHVPFSKQVSNPFTSSKRPLSMPFQNSSQFKIRTMTTITRQPEQPEEPEVFAGDSEPTIIITDRAADHLAKVSERESNPDLALRVTVEPGGCHGYQYKMDLTSEVEEDDFRFSIEGRNVHLLVDSMSLRLIKGSTIDYVTELIGSQFAIFNNPQAKGSGCGCGVSWEPNL